MKVKESITIKAPIEKVFDHWTDVERYSEWADPVIQREKLTKGPVRSGSRFHCIDKWPGKEVEFEMEITEYERNKRFGAQWFEPMKGSWSSRLSEVGHGTLLEFEIDMQLPLMMRLLAPVMKRYARNENRKFMKSFKEKMEDQNVDHNIS